MDGLSDKEKTIWFVCFVVEGVVIIFCNVIAIIIFAKKTHHSRSCILLVNQSVADLLVGAQVLYFSLQYNSISSPLSKSQDDGCQSIHGTIKVIIWSFAMDVSLTSLAFISLERACAVFKPFRHRVLRTRSYYYTILFMWLLCSLPSVAIIIFRCESFQITLAFLVSIGSLVYSLITILAVYLSIYIKLKFFPTILKNCQNQRQIKLCRTLFYASAASIVTVLPSALEKTFFKVQSDHTRENVPNLSEFTMLLLFSNSFINFFIYYWRFPEFNDDLRKLFRWKRPIVNDASAVEMEQRGTMPNSNP